MEIILVKDVENLGFTGQIVKVARGYARNHLIPCQFALEATPANLKSMEKKRAEFEARAQREKDRAKDLAGQIKQVSVVIAQKAGDKDKLYGSVTNIDLAEALAQQGVDVDRRRIKLTEPIKSLGDFEVPIKLHGDVTAMLKVQVVRAE
jgi:large subunit ribosomal protein L9